MDEKNVVKCSGWRWRHERGVIENWSKKGEGVAETKTLLLYLNSCECTVMGNINLKILIQRYQQCNGVIWLCLNWIFEYSIAQ